MVGNIMSGSNNMSKETATVPRLIVDLELWFHADTKKRPVLHVDLSVGL